MSQALTKPENRSLTLFQRASRALEAFRTKSAPDFGEMAAYDQPIMRFNNYGWNRSRGKIDHKREVGDLDLNSLAMAVVNCTALRIPEATPAVVTRTKDKEEIDPDHPCAKLIQRPNPHHIWANYAGACSMSWWFSGNVYFLKGRNDLTGEVKELWYLPHHLTRPRWPRDHGSPDVEQWAAANGENLAELDPFISHYQFSIPGKQPILYRAADILHLKRQVSLTDPRSGLGAFESLYKELLGDDKVALFTAAIMSNMGIQVPIIRPKDRDGHFEPEEASRIKENWIRKTTGDNAGEPVVWDVPVDIDKFGFSPKELELADMRKPSESRVCAVCQISPAALHFMIGLENGTSYASSQQARQQIYEEVIIPIQSVWAQTIKWQLLSEFENGDKSDFIFDTSKVRVLQEDQDAVVKREVAVFNSGGTTYDEFLVAVGKKAVGGEIGQIRMIPSLSSPTSPEMLIQKADGSLAPEPVTPIDPASLAKFADLERWFESLEAQMKGFVMRK